MAETILEGKLEPRTNDILIADKYKEIWFELPVKGTLSMQRGNKVQYIRADNAATSTNTIKLNPQILEAGLGVDVKIVRGSNGELTLYILEESRLKRAAVEEEGRAVKMLKRMKPTFVACKNIINMLLDNQIAAIDDM
jgi:hypothetical protein